MRSLSAIDANLGTITAVGITRGPSNTRSPHRSTHLPRSPSTRSAASLSGIDTLVADVAATKTFYDEAHEAFVEQVDFDFTEYDAPADSISGQIDVATDVMAAFEKIMAVSKDLMARIQSARDALDVLESTIDDMDSTEQIEQCKRTISELQSLTPSE